VIKTPTGKSQAGGDILELEIWQFFNHLVGRQARGEQIQDVCHSNTEPADTGTAPALVGIYSDALSKGGHGRLLDHRIYR
jgi:hypothetical protein